MIRNIVFDMGMVLLEYDPVKVCWEYTDNPEDVEWMRRELFDSKEWSLLDEGTLNICAGWRRKVWNTGMSTTSGRSRGWESW